MERPKLTPEQEKDLETVRGYLMSVTNAHQQRIGAGPVGSDLSEAIDWLVETIRAYAAGYDWRVLSLQAQLTAVTVLLNNVVPSLESQGGIVATIASLVVKPWLEAQKKRLEEELANPTPTPAPQ